jgi:hypothetical protein
MKTRNRHRHAHMRTAPTRPHVVQEGNPPYEVRESPIHGRGVYATRTIPLGTRLVEYTGERISNATADARYEARKDDGHTFLFVVDDRICIDAGVDGNDARFINHSCDPNCETVIENRRVYIDAIRTIQPGEELGYDYQLTWESADPPGELALYACRCGAAVCRGTMLDPAPLDQKRKAEREARRVARRQRREREARVPRRKPHQVRRGTKRTPPRGGARRGRH